MKVSKRSIVQEKRHLAKVCETICLANCFRAAVLSLKLLPGQVTCLIWVGAGDKEMASRLVVIPRACSDPVPFAASDQTVQATGSARWSVKAHRGAFCWSLFEPLAEAGYRLFVPSAGLVSTKSRPAADQSTLVFRTRKSVCTSRRQNTINSDQAWKGLDWALPLGKLFASKVV